MAATKSKKLKKIINDADVREHVLEAVQSLQRAAAEAGEAGEQLSGKAEKKLKKAKKKSQAKLEAAGNALSDAVAKSEQKSAEAKSEAADDLVKVAANGTAARSATEATGKQKRHPIRKLVMLAVLGTIIALVVSEDARKAALDALFGAEEEFQYTSSTTGGGGGSNGTA